MITAASKNKKKRQRSPPETKNSFVKNVASTVSNLWPSSIAKWFSPSPPSKANGSTPKADATDSSSEDDIPETSVVIQPSPKRMRYNSGKLNHLGKAVGEVNSSTSSADAIESYDMMQSSTRGHFKMEPNYVSTPIHTVINEPSSAKRERETTVINSPTVINKRKSLHDMLKKVSPKQEIKEKVSTETSSYHNYTQPFYKASLAGSPFYRGNLVYGGAASSYMNSFSPTTSSKTPKSETSKQDINVSLSARRVMDLLEHYASPLTEAKRILPHYSQQNNFSYNNPAEKTCLQCEEKKCYKTQMLPVPSFASILTLKRRSRLMDTTKAARQLMTTQSSVINYTPYPKNKPPSEPPKKDNSDKLTTKIKNRMTRTARGDNKFLANDLPTPVQLPTAVFEIDQNNLPKFNFNIAVGSTPTQINNESIRASTIVSSQTAKPKELSKDVQQSELKISNDSNAYKFATPVIVSRNLTIPLQQPKFTFEHPMQQLNTIDNDEKKETSQMFKIQDVVNPNTDKGKDWKCSECWVNNKPNVSNCVCCSAQKPSANSTYSLSQTKLIEGRGEDKCSKFEETLKSNGNILTPLKSLQNSNTWKCGDCWVDNADTAEKCICCGSKNPTILESTAIQPTANENDWKCNDCWIKNKHNIEKCVACGGAKPNSASNNTTDISLSLKDQKDQWVCSNCLVKNDNGINKCACCETDKRGVQKDETKKPTTTYSFGINTNTNFKFGIDPKDKDDKLHTTVPEKSFGQSFIFGFPVNKTENTLPVPASNAFGAPKQNFSFGIPNQTATQSMTPLTNQTASDNLEMNANDTAPTPVAEEKPQEVPTINFISSLTSAQNAFEPKNKVESIKNPHESLIKMANSTGTSGVPGMVGEEKSMMFKPVIVQNTTETEKNKVNKFTFPSSGLKIASNLFSVPTTNMASATSVNNAGMIPVPITTSSSLFQKSDLNVIPAANLFQRVESSPPNTNIFQNPSTTTNAATASTFTTSSKLFSFGNKSQNSMPEPSQSKFNFSFGNTNKPDTTPVFNTTFRMDKDLNTNLNSNKFPHSTPNNDGANSSIPGKPLVTGNFITTGNNPIISNASLPNNGMSTVNLLSVPDLGNNSMNAGNALKAASMLSTPPPNGLFGGAGQKENMWSNTNNSPGNLFVSNVQTNPLQRPPAFTFGSTTPSNANNNTAPAFGNNATNVFTMQNPSTNAPSLFAATPQPEQNIYGNPQTSNSSASPMSSFGRPNPSINSFNMQNPTTPIYEEQNQNLNQNLNQNQNQNQVQFQTPIFNFGSQQPANAVFGFGQPPPVPFQSPPVYNFGANKASPQFTMGTAANTTVRRVRKAVRRTQR